MSAGFACARIRPGDGGAVCINGHSWWPVFCLSGGSTARAPVVRERGDRQREKSDRKQRIVWLP